MLQVSDKALDFSWHYPKVCNGPFTRQSLALSLLNLVLRDAHFRQRVVRDELLQGFDHPCFFNSLALLNTQMLQSCQLAQMPQTCVGDQLEYQLQ